MIEIYSRVRASGLPNGTPCQPSITCGPDGPMPSTKRPPDISCRVMEVMAASAGERDCIWMMAVPTLMREVCASSQAAGEIASVPQASEVQHIS